MSQTDDIIQGAVGLAGVAVVGGLAFKLMDTMKPPETKKKEKDKESNWVNPFE